MIPLAWTWLGRLGYRAALAAQEALRERVLAGDASAERLLLLEHEPVITLGRSADPAHVVASPARLAELAVEVVPTSRGGDVTVHGPGQLVIYPVMRLARGVLAHVQAVGGAIAEELGARGVRAEWRRDPAGVWVGDRKIAACGLHVRRGVAIHGFALNVTREPLTIFSLVVPCGLAGVRVTCLLDEGGGAPPLAELAASLALRIAGALGREAQAVG